jgi:hypothetical protein
MGVNALITSSTHYKDPAVSGRNPVSHKVVETYTNQHATEGTQEEKTFSER